MITLHQFKDDVEEPKERTEHPLTLQTLLIYEDVPTRLRAWQVLEQVTHYQEQQRSTSPVRVGMCLFRDLNSEAIGETLLQQARDVDLFVVTAHGALDLPGGVQRWVEQWIALQSRPECAVVVSLDSRAGDAPLVFLRRTLWDKVQVFSHWADAATAPWDRQIDPLLASHLDKRLTAHSVPRGVV